MLSMDQKTEIIRDMIRNGKKTYPEIYAISNYEIDNLPFMAVWGSPEGTVFNVFAQFIIDSKNGKSERNIIEEIDGADSQFTGGISNKMTLPSNIFDYAKLRLDREYGMYAQPFDRNYLNYLYNFIKPKFDSGSNAIYSHSTQSNYSQTVNTTSKKTEGCYVATCCYGSYEAPQVMVLRDFRDNALNNYYFGRVFVKIYYFFSPYFVKLLKNSSFLNNHVKFALDIFVAKLVNSKSK
jgi:hypothetical protein